MPSKTVRDEEYQIQRDHLSNMLTSLISALGDIASIAADKTHRVDEVSTQSLNASVTQIQWQAEWDIYDEIITSVLVTGPVTSSFTLQLGSRFWNLSTDATGKVLIAPVQIRMKRTSFRQLTAGTPGAWTVELMGYADMGYRFK